MKSAGVRFTDGSVLTKNNFLTDLNIQDDNLIIEKYGNITKTISLSGITNTSQNNVYFVSTNGDDTNSGISINTPLLTINKAIEVATNGDVIYIDSGTYVTNTEIEINKGISLKGIFGKLNTKIKSDGTTRHRVFKLNHPNCVLEGLTISDGISPDIYGDGEGGNILILNGSKITDCIIENGSGYQYGGNIMVDQGGGIIEKCIIRGGITRFPTGSGGGIAIYDQALVTDCLIYNNTSPTGGGVSTSINSYGTLLLNNTITKNTATGWNVGIVAYGGGWVGQQQGVLKNNIIYGNINNDACFIQYSSTESFKNNNIGVSQSIGGVGISSGNYSVNPLFVNSNTDDFRLQDNSPMKGAGVKNDVFSILDLNNNFKLNTTTPDIGAYQTTINIQDLLTKTKLLSTTTPTTGQFMRFDGTNYSPYTLSTPAQYYYPCSTAAELNAALLAIHNSGGKGGEIQIMSDMSVALTQNYNINNTYIRGGSNGVSMVNLTFTNTNYCYGTFYSIEGIGVNPSSATASPFKATGQGFIKLSRIQHRGTPTEKTIDLGGGSGVYVWVDRCVSLKMTNAASATIYVYQSPDGVDAGGGTVISDNMSIISNASTITYKSDANKTVFTPTTPSHWPTGVNNVYSALNDIGEKLNSSGVTENRPSTNLYVGKTYFDTTLNKPIWYNGTNWVDNNGDII